MNISLTPELKAAVLFRVKSGLYGNASDVVRAGLRALVREEKAAAYKQWLEMVSKLPQDPITPEIEQQIEEDLRVMRREEERKARK
jgi:antitoxin ParD1/3/4